VVGVERFGDVEVGVRFFPYRGAIRKEGAAKRSSPLSRSGLSLDSIFRELWNVGFEDSLKVLKHVWNLHFRFLEVLKPTLGFSDPPLTHCWL
jgi:hypothetical protein